MIVPSSFTISVGEYPYYLWASVTKTGGGGITVAVYGGNIPHVGTSVIAIPRSSLRHKSRISSTVSAFNLVGHKDEVIAKMVGSRLAEIFNEPVVVVAGVHLGKEGEYGASKEDIRRFLQLAKDLAERLVLELGRAHDE